MSLTICIKSIRTTYINYCQMRKILYFIGFIFCFMSCDSDINEEGLYFTFISDGNQDELLKLRDYGYINSETAAVFYSARFSTGVGDKLWSPGEDSEYGSFFYNTSGYNINSKRGHYGINRSNAVNYDPGRDFQIEIEILSPLSGDQYTGLVFDAEQKVTGKECRVTPSSIIIVDNDKSNVKEIALQNEAKTGSHLITVRKVNNKIAFFYNKSLIHIRDYIHSKESNVGYLISNNMKVTITRLEIHYLK